MTQSKLILQPCDQLFSCLVADLKPHPAFERLGLAPDAARLSGLAKRGDAAFDDIVSVTTSLKIIDGYELVQLARSRKRTQVMCLRLQLSEEEALLSLLHKHQRAIGMRPFTRILLALELESWFREKAKSNQSHGGQMKALSTLTEASAVDVRKEIAAAAGVAVGNISKAKAVLAFAASEVLEGTKHGEISLHKAWLWSRLNHRDQQLAYRRYRSEREITTLARKLLSAQPPATPHTKDSSADHLRAFLSTLKVARLDHLQLEKLNALLEDLSGADTTLPQAGIDA